MPDTPDRPPTGPQPTAAPPAAPTGVTDSRPAPPSPPSPSSATAPPSDQVPPPGGGPGRPWGAPTGASPWGPGGPTGPGGPAGPGAPPPIRRSAGGANPALTLIGSAITLVLGAVVAAGLAITSDLPGDYFSGRFFPTMVAALAAAAAPVALLLSWDEIDLSSFGAAALGGYVYVEVGDGDVLPGLIAAAFVGLVAGAVMGVVRWLTGAPSALVTLGGGTVLSGIALHDGPGPSGAMSDALIDDATLPIVTMLAVIGAAIVLAVVLRETGPAPRGAFGPPGSGPYGPPGPGAFGAPATPYPAGAVPAGVASARPTVARAPGVAGPRVIPAFALSVLAAALFGAFLAGARGFTVAEHVTTVPVLVFAAVAIGGVVRGSGPFAPVVAAVAALVVVVVQDATRSQGWEIGDQQLVLGSLFVVCTAVAHGLRRITARPEPGPGASF